MKASVSPAPRAGPPQHGRGRVRSEETRRADIQQKKKRRSDVRALINQLWELEKGMRKRETPARRPGIYLQVSVLEDLVERIAAIKAAGRQSGPCVALAQDMRQGLLNSSMLGVLYVCVDDWRVVESSKGMELVCPFDLVRGYVGYSLPCFVHSEDQEVLQQVLRSRIQSFTRGSAEARKTASLRLLRVCLDSGGVLVMDYVPLNFEVVHVGKDEAHGGKVHALLTCNLELASVAPLEFSTLEKIGFQASANAVSGCFALESHQVHMGMGPGKAEPATERAERFEGVGSVQAALGWLLRLASKTARFDELLDVTRMTFFPTIKNFVRLHTLLGVAPDGVPWVDRSVAVEALGISSGYSPYFVARMSGDLTWTSLFTEEEPRPFLFGVLKTPLSLSLPGKIGLVGLGFERGVGEGGRQRIWMHTRQEWTHYPSTGVESKMYQSLFHGGGGGVPEVLELDSRGVAPPRPELVSQFCRFDQRCSS